MNKITAFSLRRPVLFALLPLSDVFTVQLSLQAALTLVGQTLLVAVWWGGLVIWGGSLRPAVLHHWMVNALAGIQGLSMFLVEPASLAYARNCYFSIPLAIIGIWLVLRLSPRHSQPYPWRDAR